MARQYSTLLTSPVSMVDFVARLAFFAVAPFMIVAAATLFPVWGAIIDVALAILIFLFASKVRKMTSRHSLLRKAVAHALEFESFYSEKLPRPFWYYALYPLLFPYWLYSRPARREFLLFRSYTLGALAVLLASLTWQYYRYWQPDLQLVDILPTVALTILVELLLVLALLMPIATTVVWYHASFRPRRLAVVLLVALTSTSLSVWRITNQRDPIVSFSTRQRVKLRSEVAPERAHDALLQAARVARSVHDAQLTKGLPDAEAKESWSREGNLEGPALDEARLALRAFYKPDETYAFDLWLNRSSSDQMLVIYSPSRRKLPAIWLGLDAQGAELKALSDLPPSGLKAMRHAAGGDVPLFPWSASAQAKTGDGG